MLLIEQQILPSPILYLSAFFEATRDEYYRQLHNVSSKGTWEDWLIYFLNGVAIQAEDVLSRAERINELLEQWKIKMAGTKPAVSLEIIDHLAVNPYFTINKIVAELSVPYTTAQRSVKNLENMGIVKRIKNGKRDSIYCATEIMAILEEATRINMSF